MSPETQRPKIGVLALTLELYESLLPGLRQNREGWVRAKLLPALAGFAEVSFRDAVFSRETIEAEVQELENDGATILLVLLLTYSPSQHVLPALSRTRLPILIWNTQELFEIDTRFSVKAMIDNHGVHGTQDLANVLARSSVPFHFVTSHPADSAAVAEIQDFALAALAVRRLRQARIGLLGYPFPGMGDFAVDTTALAKTLGPSWISLSVEDYVRRAASASGPAVGHLVAQYRAAYDVAPDLTPADLESTARVELALRGMVADHGLSAISYQFLAFGDDERTPTVPFVAASRLMAEGVGFGGEGDLIAAAGTSLFHWLCPPGTFSEIFTIDFAGNALFMSHMGEANVAMARRDRKVPMVARPSPITRTRDRQLALVTSLEPGPATFLALTLGPQQTWRIIASPVMVEDFGPLSDFCVPHFKIHPQQDVREFLTAYARVGGPHHNAVCFGDALRRARFAAALCGADYFQI